MATSAGEDPVDLGPWSAYVVGRHPYALADWHTESWVMMRASGTVPDRGALYGAPHELWELDEALSILARQGRVDVAVLDGFRRSLGRFVAVSKEIHENVENPQYGSEGINWEAEEAPCNLELISMMLNSSKLFTGPEELGLWEQCGAAIGDTLLPPDCLVSSWRWKGPQDRFQALEGAFQGLNQTGDYPFLAALEGRLRELDPGSAWKEGSDLRAQVDLRLQRLAALDEELRQALRSQAPPEVWLDLDKDRLIFFGARYYLNRVPAGEKVQDYLDRLTMAEAAFLWLLAERPGEEVSRDTIESQGELARTANDLDFVATPLRKKLRPAIEAFLAKRGGILTEFAMKAFIEGVRGKNSLGGPYILRLDPSRVRVSGPRPF